MPTPKVDVDAEVETKPEAAPDDGLFKIYQRYDKANSELKRVGEQVDGILVEAVTYVKAQKLSREVVKVTLQKRGHSEASVASELSRIFKFANPKNEETFLKLKNHEISTADARKLIVSKPQTFPAKMKKGIHERVLEHLYTGAKIAINDLKADEGEKLFNSQGDFTAVAGEAWRKAWDEQAAKVAEGAKPAPAAVGEDQAAA